MISLKVAGPILGESGPASTTVEENMIVMKPRFKLGALVATPGASKSSKKLASTFGPWSAGTFPAIR